MPNTISTDLNIQSVASAATPLLESSLAPIGSFCTLATARVAPGGLSLAVPRVTVPPTVQTNATNFEAGDMTVTADQVTAAHISISGHLSSADLQGGALTGWLVPSLVREFARSLWALAVAPVTTGNFATAVTSAPAAFGQDSFGPLANAVRSANRCLVIDSVAHANISDSLELATDGTWRHPTFPAGVHESSEAFASASIVGFAADKRAVSGLIASPEMPPLRTRSGRELYASTVIALPGLQVPVLFATWVNPRYRVTWISLEVLAGFVAADTAALRLIVAP